MLLKVKPDGPVYEVHFISQLITLSDNAKSVSTAQLQSDITPRTSVSDIVSDGIVASVDGGACPVPSVSNTRGQMTGHVTAAASNSSRVPQSSAAFTQQIQTRPLMYRDSQPISDSVLNRNATSVTHVSGSSADTKAVQDFVTTESCLKAVDGDRWDVKPNSIVLLMSCKYPFLFL